MKKSTKIVKRLLALFLVVLMSIESFGALVSDNDGSAFITKGEFDSLKSSFQSQIDNYNTSIDSKIDGAIAAYLAGVNIAKEVTYNVEFKNWETVMATNYVLPESWKIPNLNLSFNYNYASTNDSGSWFETWWGTGALKFERDLSNYQVRNLVSAGVESTTYTLPDKVVWLGQSQNYVENIIGVKTGICKSVFGGLIPGNSYLVGATGGNPNISVVYSLMFGQGYIANRAANDIWGANLFWYHPQQPAWRVVIKPTVDSDWINANLSTSISLNYVDGKQYKNEHILNWDNYSYTNLSDPTWTNSLGPNPAWSEDDVVKNTYVQKTGKWSVFELQDDARGGQGPSQWLDITKQYGYGVQMNTQITYCPTIKDFGSFYSGNYGEARTNNIMSVGVLNKTYTSSDIYQWSNKHTLNRDEKKFIENVNLLNGFVVGYAKMDETFKWEPKVTGTYYDTATNTDKPITKWRVKLSKAPFGTKDSVAAATDVLKNKNQTADYLVTDETKNTCKFEVEIGEDTVIFCKWWPDDVNICDNYAWSGTLDLKACGTYTIKES